MTPTKQQIYELARELWFQDRLRREGAESLEINPTLEELREEGFILVAQQQLMRNTDEYRTYLERETNETKLPQVHNGLLFDFWEAKKSNILISGTNSTGKSRLACQLVSTLMNLGWQIIAFDNSSMWKRISDIPIYIEVEQGYLYEIPILEHKSVVYDISELLPETQKQFVDYVLRDLWENRDNQNLSWLLLALEEFELYGRTVRGSTAQNLFRIMHAGRNKQIRVLGVTTDLALIDSSFIRLCGLRYHARLNIEVNSKRRFKQYYGKEWLLVANSLECGKFIYLNKNKLQLIDVPLFTAKRKPISYSQYLTSLQPTPKPKSKTGFWAKLLQRLQ